MLLLVEEFEEAIVGWLSLKVVLAGQGTSKKLYKTLGLLKIIIIIIKIEKLLIRKFIYLKVMFMHIISLICLVCVSSFYVMSFHFQMMKPK